jgi:fermentation-respiration switch protein FrsA (DUF1100 family)
MLSAGALASADPLRTTGPTVAASTSKWPSIEDRYRLADRYLRQNMNGLLMDSDLRAAFVTGDRGVIYHLGPPGYPYMDVSRVGVYGGSAGGYDAARFILRRPSFFKVAVASSGNHDLRLDKAWWPEVSMGYADAATWERNSNMSVASNLTGKLLLIHGDIDDNVPVTESLRLARALIQANRDVDLVILPDTTHAVGQPFFLKKFRDYFTRNLLDEAPPSVQQSAPNSAGAAQLVH